MDRKRIIKINILVCIIILIGFISMIAISYNTYSNVIRDDIKNISKLTATNIYADISNQLTKPIFVSLTMANDKFVDDWLIQEKEQSDSEELQQKIKKYLEGIKEKYDYTSVFLVSDYSKKYYYFDGINKVIHDNNQHDQWYYNFINSNRTYDLEVDTDEANQNKLSVFINCRIVDDNGELLGVTGVGVEMNQVQELLASFKSDFMLEAMLFDKEGMIQVHSDSSLIKKENLFDNQILENHKDDILNNKNSVTILEYKEGGYSGYMITKYIDDLDWYLMVKKDTTILNESFQSIILQDFIVFFIVLFCIILIISRLIKINDKKLLRIARTDALTSLPNRRSFDEELGRIIQNTKEGKPIFVFVLDIDNFKGINDAYGHLTGDKLICEVGMIVHTCLMKQGAVYRWGGDEFTGYILGNWDEKEEIIERVFHSIRESNILDNYKATISMGVTSLKENDSVELLLKRADKALYQAKQDGKNRYHIT